MNEQLVEKIMNFELGKLTNPEVIDLMKDIKSEGCILSLQRHYHHLWNTLIDLGVLETDKSDKLISNLSA
tara:strand:+ start:514 stop:723 length:210 start_codon:yes stop_codon:yes gene_type:complete